MNEHPIRILHYIGLLDFGGSQAFVMEIYRRIDRSKIQFDFVVFTNQETEFYNEIISLGGHIFESPQFNGKNYFKFVRWWNDFLEDHQEYMILHGHVRSVSSIYLPIAHRHGLITIMHSHSTSNGSGLIAKIKDIMQYPARFQADYLFACSSEAGEWMFGKNKVKKENYKVIRNAINAQRFVFDPCVRSIMRKKLGISDSTYVMGHLGRMVPAKNHIFLIDIMIEVQKQIPDSKLLLVGDGELRKDLEFRIQEQGLEKCCILVGSQGNTQDFYQAMDIFIFPSLWEGFGISAIEAQASGLPCIISDAVPKSVDIGADLAFFLPLKHCKVAWVQKIIDLKPIERNDWSLQVKNAGFDITENVSWIQNFYIEKGVKRET